MTFRIALLELRRLFLSPLAWSVLAVEQLILAYFFLIGLDNYIALQPRLAAVAGAPGVTALVAAPLLGMVLLVASFIAVGLFMSSLTAQPTIAAVSTFGVLLLLWIIDWAGSSRVAELGSVQSYLSMLRHYEPLLKGMFNTSDVVYYLLLIATFLILTIRRLDAERLQH